MDPTRPDPKFSGLEQNFSGRVGSGSESRDIGSRSGPAKSDEQVVFPIFLIFCTKIDQFSYQKAKFSSKNDRVNLFSGPFSGMNF